MAIAAVPNYLPRQDLLQTSPGMRFSLFLPIWTTHDDQIEMLKEKSNKKSREAQILRDDLERWGFDTVITQWVGDGKLPDLWEKNEASAKAAWRYVIGLTPGDQQVLAALLERQSAMAEALQGAVLSLHAQSVAPFATGLGNEHPLENGFAFLNPYGLPYLPGSGVKGVLRQAARELARGQWGDTQGWTQAAIDVLFGPVPTDGSDEGHERGALICWDVLPQLANHTLAVEVMTPHQTHYLQGHDNPHDSGSPNPISFLSVPPGSGFVFHIVCDGPFLRARYPELAEAQRWCSLVQAALTHAFDWLGFGAKTAVGYGAMRVDAQREQQAQAQRQERAQAEALARLTPQQRAAQQAQEAVEVFVRQYEAARKAHREFKPSIVFSEERLSFMRHALTWEDVSCRRAAAEALTASATKAWGRPSNKERWQELQQAIEALRQPLA